MEILKKYKDVLIVLLIALVAYGLSLIFKFFGASVLAIIIGFIVSIFVRDKNDNIIKFVVGKSLNTAIFTMGFSINVGLIVALGPKMFLITIFSLIVTMIISLFIGKFLNMGKKFSILFAIGNSICGSTAILSANSHVKANKDDEIIAISVANVIGFMLMFLLPLVIMVFKLNVLKGSFMIGSTIQSIAQVVAGASIAGSKYMLTSTVVKLIRVIMLAVVLIVLPFIVNKNKKSSSSKVNIEWNKVFPLFLIGFVCAIIVVNTISIPHQILNIIHLVSVVSETIALGAIGYQINIRVIIKQFNKLFSLISITFIFQVCLGLVLCLFI